MTAEQIKKLCASIGLRPQIAAGQNFLLDETIAESMVDLAGVQAGETVLEIGPGFGILTTALLAAEANVIGVELDQRLGLYLKKNITAPNFKLVVSDIFKLRLADVVEDKKYKLVSNLPYSATSLVLRNFLSLAPRPTSLTVMVQAEVADRVAAPPGRMSLLSLMAQYYSDVSIPLEVPRAKFFPIPNVDSAVLHLAVGPTKTAAQEKNLFRVARAGFSARRKLLSNSLAASLHLKTEETKAIMKKAKVPDSARAQELSVDDWLRLAKSIV